MPSSSLRKPLVASLAVAVVVATAAAALATAPGHDGRIAFRRYLGPDRTKGAIFTIAPDGTGERQLTTPPPKVGDDYPDVAADGSFVAFQRCAVSCRIYTVRPDATGLTSVGAGCTGTQEPPACADSSYPAIAPDRRRIAFVRAFGHIRKDQIDHVGIYAMRVDGTHLRRVTLPRARTAEDVDPQWSPDGRRLVFVRKNVTAKPAGGQAVFVVDADGSALHRVTPWKLRAGDGPDWSPDGSRILFRSPETEDFLNSDIFTIHPDGTGLRRVTHVAAQTKVYSASFSPDGAAITLGLTGVDQQADVYTIAIDGTALTPVTRTPSWDSAPDWGGAP
ncbi:MAG: TolB protein [Solirubrobacteraceae bacterium]|jgi:dipeptidyl aminopeptidase/acylaminoacyl peptidase|nr:TolB protein [Solirubrobacteraceae bacterium]